MNGSLIVLNGPSSVGKTSIATALQALWPRPLLATGVDTFIVGWPDTFTTFPGADAAPSAPTTGIRLVPGAGPAPSWVPELGEDFHHVMFLAHRAWVLIAEGGVDQVIDHVLFDDALRHDALSTLVDAFWVGIYCDFDEATRRAARRSSHGARLGHLRRRAP